MGGGAVEVAADNGAVIQLAVGCGGIVKVDVGGGGVCKESVNTLCASNVYLYWEAVRAPHPGAGVSAWTSGIRLLESREDGFSGLDRWRLLVGEEGGRLVRLRLL